MRSLGSMIGAVSASGYPVDITQTHCPQGIPPCRKRWGFRPLLFTSTVPIFIVRDALFDKIMSTEACYAIGKCPIG
jgi:hypothetical protein